MGRKTDCFHFLKFSAIKRISCEIETSETAGEEGEAEHIDEMIQDVLAEVSLTPPVSRCYMFHLYPLSSQLYAVGMLELQSVCSACVYVMSTLYLYLTLNSGHLLLLK